jgi:hypothetical protein
MGVMRQKNRAAVRARRARRRDAHSGRALPPVRGHRSPPFIANPNLNAVTGTRC